MQVCGTVVSSLRPRNFGLSSSVWLALWMLTNSSRPFVRVVRVGRPVKSATPLNGVRAATLPVPMREPFGQASSGSEA